MQEILEKCHLVFIEVGGTGGSAKLNPEDLGIDIATLPPGVVDLGRKTIVDPGVVAKFGSCRRAAQRACINKGTRFKSGVYLIPDEKLESLKGNLSLIEERYNSFRDALLDSFEAKVEEWAAKADKSFPGWGDKIRGVAPSIEEVAKRLVWDVPMVSIGLPRVVEVGDGGIGKTLTGMPGQIAKEISFDAAEWVNPGEGNLAVTNIQARLDRIREKALSLSFLDGTGKLAKVADLISSVTAMLPKSGKIDGVPYLMVRGLMDILSDPTKLMSESVLDVQELVPLQEPINVSQDTETEAIEMPLSDPSEVFTAAMAW